MRLKLLLLAIIIAVSASAQDKLSVPGFGELPLAKDGDTYSLNFGKFGKFNFSGTVNPLSLSTIVEMDDLKAFPGVKVLSMLGLQEIEFKLTERDFEIAGNIEDKFKDDIFDLMAKIDVIKPVIGKVKNTLEIQESKVSLTFDKNLELNGLVDLNIFVFGGQLPIPEIEGKIDPKAILNTVVSAVKDEGLNEIAKVGKVVAEAVTESSKAIAGAMDDAMKIAKTASRHVTHTKSDCDNKCVPRHARKLSKPLRLASNVAITKFYDKVSPQLMHISGAGSQQTAQMRSKFVKAEWNNLVAKIDNDWKKIRGDKSYVRFYLKPSSATNGGHIYRRKVDEYKQQHIDFRNRIWSRMMNEKEQEFHYDNIYFVKSVSEGKWWDAPGYSQFAGRESAKIGLYKKDNYRGKEGADRFIKVIPHKTNKRYVFLQPQHSDLVVDITGGVSTPGAELQLWYKGENNEAQMFEMKRVRGESKTYYLKNAKSGLYLTAHSKGPVTQEKRTRRDNQKWRFENAGNPYLMAPPSKGLKYAIENVKARKYFDIPGSHRKTEKKAAKLQLWNLDGWPDRYHRLVHHGVGDQDYFYIQPMHDDYVLNVIDGKINNGNRVELWNKQDELKQQFRFIYAGVPHTYYIQDRNSGKFLDASLSKINKNGCPVQIWAFNGQDQQKWKLHEYAKWQIPPSNQDFLIKAAFCNNEYWDPDGDNAGKGDKIKNWALDDGKDRLFRIKKSGDHSWIYIESGKSRKMVDIPNNSHKTGNQLRLWDGNSADAQKFAIEFTSPTTFVLVTKKWKSIDIYGNPDKGSSWRKNGNKIQVNRHGYSIDRHWQLIYADGPNVGKPYIFNKYGATDDPNKSKKKPVNILGKTFIIQSALNYGKNKGGGWDIPGGKNPDMKNGANLEAWENNGGRDQNYVVRRGTIKGFYKLTPAHNSKYCVNVDGGKTKNGTNVELWSNNHNRRQNFRFEHQGGGRFKIYDCNGRVVGLSGRSSNNGSNIHIWEDHNGKWMEWYLIDVRTRKPYKP